MINLAVILAVAFVAAQAKHTPERPFVGHSPNPSTAMSGPYQSLFRVELPKPSTPTQVQVAEPTTRYGRAIEMTPRFERGGCNMPIIVARPEVDPRMIVTPPESVKDAAKIRAIEPPPPCGQQ